MPLSIKAAVFYVSTFKSSIIFSGYITIFDKIKQRTSPTYMIISCSSLRQEAFSPIRTD